jgi:S1-C subfamily serine protease
VAPGASATLAGITAGELISGVNGQKVHSLADLQGVLAQLTPGSRVPVIVVGQNGSSRTVTVVLGQLQG